MELQSAQALAQSLLNQYGLLAWTFKFDNAVKRFGQCSYRSKTISLSKPLVLLNSEAEVKHTILHEIAHALVGTGHGHNQTWVRTAKSIGCNGNRCYSSDEVVTPPMKYTLHCTTCGRDTQRARRPRFDIACGRCCNKFNGGKWSKEYIYEVKEN